MRNNKISCKPNNAHTIKFLKLWRPSGPWVLTAINPNEKGIITKTFYPNYIKELIEWLNKYNARWNLYFHVNTTMRDLTSKATREDIKSVDWLHIDLDPDVGRDISNEKERYLYHLTDNLPRGIPKPTVIIDSGSGIHAYWKLKNSIIVDGNINKAEYAKLYNHGLEQKFGADNCHNIDRIMRLPGTINIPDIKKRKKGRVEALARVIDFNNRHYEIDIFEPSVMVTPQMTVSDVKIKIPDNIQPIKELEILDQWNIPDRIKIIIAQGKHPNQPKTEDNSRSIWLFDCVCELVRKKVPDDIIFSIITDVNWAISESVVELGNQAYGYAARQIQRAKDTVNNKQKDFTRDKNGAPLRTQENVILALEKLNITVKYNEFSDRNYISGLKEFDPYLSDAAITRMYLDIDKNYGFRVSKEMFWMIVTDQARRNSFHPVRDYLMALKWDGKPRIDSWLIRYGGAEDTPFNRAAGRVTLIAAIRRIMKPGCKFDEMLILEGAQGCGKSTALKILAVNEEWFIDDLPLDRDSKKNIESLAGHWIVEAGELKGMRKGEIENLKAFLSRDTDKARMAYGRIVTISQRQCIIIGTTNNYRYLKDSTGNRRFWPVKVDMFDLEALAHDIDQIWAEAYHYEAQGATIRLDPELYNTAHIQQELRRVGDPFVEILHTALENKVGKIQTEDLWKILDITKDRRTQEHNNRLGAAMQELGWKSNRLRFNGKLRYCYVKGTAEELLKEVETDIKPVF